MGELTIRQAQEVVEEFLEEWKKEIETSKQSRRPLLHSAHLKDKPLCS